MKPGKPRKRRLIPVSLKRGVTGWSVQSTGKHLTAMTLIEAGADIVVLRHAESVRRVKVSDHRPDGCCVYPRLTR